MTKQSASEDALAERARCVAIVSDHINALRKVFQNDVARALEQVRDEMTRGPTP